MDSDFKVSGVENDISQAILKAAMNTTYDILSK